MAKRVLRVEWQSHPTADGRERLAKAVNWVLEHASKRAPPPRLDAEDEALVDGTSHEEASQ